MANRDFPKGFIPKRRLGGGCLVFEKFSLAATHDAIGIDDPLERRSDGFVHRAQAGSTTIIAVAAEYKAANAGGTILACPALDLVMSAQGDDNNIAAQTDLDLNYDIVYTAPDSLTHRSKMEIDASSKAATATLPIKILKVEDDSAFGEFASVECIFNQSVLKGAGVNG